MNRRFCRGLTLTTRQGLCSFIPVSGLGPTIINKEPYYDLTLAQPPVGAFFFTMTKISSPNNLQRKHAICCSKLQAYLRRTEWQDDAHQDWHVFTHFQILRDWEYLSLEENERATKPQQRLSALTSNVRQPSWSPRSTLQASENISFQNRQQTCFRACCR